MANLEVFVASGDRLDIRNFSVREKISSLFVVQLTAVSDNKSVDFDAILGQPARFVVNALRVQQQPGSGVGTNIDIDVDAPLPAPRIWEGICNQIQQIETEENGVARYHVSVVPAMWLLTQRRNYRIFQHMSEVDAALKLLKEWGVEPALRLDRSKFKKRKYKVQYAETDFDFVSRLFEEAGISYYFEQQGDKSVLVLSDAPQSNKPRAASLPFVDEPSGGGIKKEYVTNVVVDQKVRPGKYTMRDHDYRKQPDYNLAATATDGLDVEQLLERFHYTPGAFLYGADKGEDTPSADDRGKARTDEREGAALAQKRLEAKRSSGKRFVFETNALDLAPGAVFSVVNHTRADLGEKKPLLVLDLAIDGSPFTDWAVNCEAVSALQAYRPALVTARPSVRGVESATVVGPKGEEIHTDEFGRIRVHFHWDRESKMDDGSSCWIHVSQPWSGSGYGATNLPRVGQEVLVDFLGGDPDRPIVVGRVFTNLQKTPYKLPENKTQSGWRTQSTGGSGGYNEIMFDDKNGKELFFTRAERDRRALTKRNAEEAILGSRTTSVARDDQETVSGSQRLAVSADREVNVGGEQTHTVKATITFTSQEGDTRFQSKNGFHSSAARQTFEATGTIEITCHGSTIVITPDSISLNAPKVLINGAPVNAGGGAGAGADAGAGAGADSEERRTAAE